MKENDNISWSELLRKKAGAFEGGAPEMSFAEIKEKMLAAAAARKAAVHRRTVVWLRAAAVVAVIAAAGVWMLVDWPGGSSGERVAEVIGSSEVVGPEGNVAEVVGSPEVAGVEGNVAEVVGRSEVAVVEGVKQEGDMQEAVSHEATTEQVYIVNKSAGSEAKAVKGNLVAQAGGLQPEGQSNAAEAASVAASETTSEAASESSSTSAVASASSAPEAASASTSDLSASAPASVSTTEPQQKSVADPFAEPVKTVRKQFKRFSLGASGFLASNSVGSGNVRADNAPKGMYIYTDSNGKMFYSFGAPTARYYHSAPVSGGISLRYSFTKHFYAETGARFTYLHTWVSPTGASQDLLYAGIPVGVGCNFVTLGDFDMYGSVYGMPSKCIFGRSNSNFPSNYASLADIPLMWSAGASLGASYGFGRIVSLFAEPTLSYYFPNDDAPQTLYKENPFYFTLNLGLRFNLR